MIDLITYIPNVEEFRAEAQVNAENNVLGFSIDDDDNLSYDVGKIPVFYHKPINYTHKHEPKICNTFRIAIDIYQQII